MDWRTGFLMLMMATVPTAARGAPRQVARQVQAGIAKHQAGDFVAAEKEFAQAAKALPNDPRLAFDQACALAAQGKHDEAEKLFQLAKRAKDPRLIAATHYNLGCAAAAQARVKFGEQPEEATPEIRADGLKLLEQAVARYRDCLAVESEHAAARHNLELVRLWIKQMQEVWKDRDRDKKRQELGLLEFLEMIQGAQSELRGQTQALPRADDSPKRRQAATLLGQSQRDLADEIEPLQEKLRAAIQSPAGPVSGTSSPPPQPDPALEQALTALMQKTHQAKSAMTSAAADLATQRLGEATTGQTHALEQLNEVYRAVAPFEHVLQKAIATQDRLRESTRAISTTPPSAGNSDPARHIVEADLPREEKFIVSWTETIPSKAEKGLEQLMATPAVAGPPPPPSSNNSANAPTAPDPAQQRAAMKEALELAIKLAPEATEKAKLATSELEKQAWSNAESSQAETLRLLREIADKLPKQPPQDQQNQDDKQDQKKDQDQKNSPQDKNQQNQPNEPPPDQPKQEQSQKQAEAMLRKVRERERDYKDQQKKMKVLVGGGKVDKDW